MWDLLLKLIDPLQLGPNNSKWDQDLDIHHTNPNCQDSSRCYPHGSEGPVDHRPELPPEPPRRFDDAFPHVSYERGFSVSIPEEEDWIITAIRESTLRMQHAAEHSMRHMTENTDCVEGECPDWTPPPPPPDPGPDCICKCECPCFDCTHENCADEYGW